MPLLTLNEIENLIPVFRGKFGNALGKGAMHLLSIEKVNNLYDNNLDYYGPDFAHNVLKDIGVEYELLNSERLDSLPQGPFITISNHPYGHIDGVMLVDLFGHLRDDYKVMVNKFLGRIEPLGENFICVTPIGEERGVPTKESIQGIKDAVAHIRAGHPLGIFPSGAVSDLSLKEGCIRDRKWQEPVIKFIKKMNVPIVPVHFQDRNSNLYYSLGLIDWRIRLLRLPAEVFNKHDRRIRIAIGEIISPDQSAEFTDPTEFGEFLRNMVYSQH